MKTLYFSMLTALFSLTTSAQLTQANHAPAPSDYHQMLRCDSVDPGNGGSGILWNFSTLNIHTNLTVTYSTIASNFTDYPGATIAVISGTDASYFDSDANSLKFYGGNFGVGKGLTAVVGGLVYSNYAVQAKYPMSFGTSSTSAIAGSIVVVSPLSTSGTFTGSSNVFADGTGTLTLPGSLTYTNVLRVVTSQTVDFTTLISDGQVILRDYNYYVDGYKFPFLTIATATANTALGNTTQTIVTTDKTPGITSIQEFGSLTNSVFAVYPNPANNVINFSTNHPDAIAVNVFDITGKLILKQNMEEGKSKLDVSDLNQGLYLYTIVGSTQKNLKSGKFTVTH